MWTLSEALELVRYLQPKLHALNYHVALGGGVLNKGMSDKDLDLYVFTFDRSMTPPILPFFESLWGKSEALSNSVLFPEMSDYPPDLNFETKVKFHVGGKRIDLFITKNGVNEFNGKDR